MPGADVTEMPLQHPARHNFLGVPVDCLTLSQTITVIDQAIRNRQSIQHVCINVAKFVAMRTNPELDRDVRSSDIINIDGMGIVWAARLLGVRVPERVSGIDLMERLIQLCAVNKYRPYFLGATPDVLQASISNFQKRFVHLELAGSQHGYFAGNQEREIIRNIKESGADCLFIGMPTPHKERLLARFRDDFSVPFIMGVGGAFDVFAGRIYRAPRAIQDVGLEWLFRTAQEPLRLGPRYVKTNAAFAKIVSKAIAAKLFSDKLRP
jgi:N-acetylglucosaminyldiphosphoundecaprenol N-acetyl-beta-D-mannosaminyltransferase